METRKEFFQSRLAERLLHADLDDPEIGEQMTWQLPLATVQQILRTTQGVAEETRNRVCEIVTEDLQEYVTQGWIQVLVVRAYLAILLVGDPERGLRFTDSLTECDLLMEAVLEGWRARFSPRE